MTDNDELITGAAPPLPAMAADKCPYYPRHLVGPPFGAARCAWCLNLRMPPWFIPAMPRPDELVQRIAARHGGVTLSDAVAGRIAAALMGYATEAYELAMVTMVDDPQVDRNKRAERVLRDRLLYELTAANLTAAGPVSIARVWLDHNGEQTSPGHPGAPEIRHVARVMVRRLPPDEVASS